MPFSSVSLTCRRPRRNGADAGPWGRESTGQIGAILPGCSPTSSAPFLRPESTSAGGICPGIFLLLDSGRRCSMLAPDARSLKEEIPGHRPAPPPAKNRSDSCGLSPTLHPLARKRHSRTYGRFAPGGDRGGLASRGTGRAGGLTPPGVRPQQPGNGIEILRANCVLLHSGFLATQCHVQRDRRVHIEAAHRIIV